MDITEKCKDDKSFARAVIASWNVLVLISIPVELYVSNPGNFQFSFWQYCFVLISGACLIALFFYFIDRVVLRGRIRRVCQLILFSFLLMGYVQSMFLNSQKLEVLTGETQNWSQKDIITNAVLWSVACIIIVLLGLKDKVCKVYRVLAIYLMLIQIATTAYLMVTGNGYQILTGNMNNSSAFKALTDKGSLEISDANNVIVFVLDRFDAEFFEEIYEDDAEFIQPLKDFTYYPDSTGQFARTDTAISYLLTGTAWTNAMDESTYASYAWENSDVLQSIVAGGYRIGLYTNDTLVSEECKLLTVNYDNHMTKYCSYINTLRVMTKCSLYRMAPFALKTKFSYYTSDITDLITNEEIWNIDNDLPFYTKLTTDGLQLVSAEDSKGTFYFYHLFGTHEPTNLSENMENVKEGSISLKEQGRATLKILYEYFEQLQELGKYDDATIIITADHGNQLDDEYYEEYGIVDRTTRPCVLVKQSGETHDTMKVSEAAVSQEEFLPTILKALGIENDMITGKSYDEVTEEDETIRQYASVWNSEIYEYIIQGDARDKTNWILEYSNQ